LLYTELLDKYPRWTKTSGDRVKRLGYPNLSVQVIYFNDR